jgi:hypothetical protein
MLNVVGTDSDDNRNKGDTDDDDVSGKAVFCEKPITADISSTLACYDLADKMKQPLFCAFHR